MSDKLSLESLFEEAIQIESPEAQAEFLDAGLFDMHGNLWEWTQNSSSGSLSPVTKNVKRVLGGGSFDNLSSFVRCAHRNGFRTEFLFGSGFRPSRTYHLSPGNQPAPTDARPESEL